MSLLSHSSGLARAGAGTGKTERLARETQSLHTLFQKAQGRPPRLIVCTFTNKARQELKTRLFKIAREELNGQTSPFDKPCATGEIFHENEAPPQAKKAFEKEGGHLFLQYIQSPALRISTIDSILSLFLKKHGHKIDLRRDFQIEPGANGKLFDSLAGGFVFKKNLSLLKKLNYDFLKRLFLFYCKMRLSHKDVGFCNKKDFEDFLQSRELFLSNKKLLKQKPEAGEWIFSAKQKGRLLADLILSQKPSAVNRLFEEAESFQSSAFVPLFEEFDSAGRAFFPLFMERKKKSGILDRDDLIPLCLHLLRERPETAQAFSKDWDHWLIDEYQDTGKAQEQIISRITGFKNVFCVGDPGQSIYLFRDADPEVFSRREQAAPQSVQRLNVNYRSAASLIHFYNDFFTKPVFMKFRPPKGARPTASKPCVHFLTYKPEPKALGKQSALKALCAWIQDLKSSGESLSDIAVLSSKNEFLEQAGAFLRAQKIPLVLNSSRNFAHKRLIKDALFLLKFLINPRDNNNLKALLRTSCFFMRDQELADSCHDHFEHCRHKERISFWAFIKSRFRERAFARSLQSFLQDTKELGLVKAFEKALKESGLTALALFQDPTGSSTANLYKLVSLLNESEPSALPLFYSLMGHNNNTEETEKEAPPCGNSGEAVELMSIHKAKGLEFKYVAVLDFSLNSSSLKAGGRESKTKADIIYDESEGKMLFSVPFGGRDGKKVKPYPGKLLNKTSEKALLEEKERLFYVALTRAKSGAALFVPQAVPQTNSPLANMDFFRKNFVSDKGLSLLEEEYDEKNRPAAWHLNEGLYKSPLYSFAVCDCDSFCKKPARFDKPLKPATQSLECISAGAESKRLLPNNKQAEPVKAPGQEELLIVKSSRNFVEDVLEKKPVTGKSVGENPAKGKSAGEKSPLEEKPKALWEKEQGEKKQGPLYQKSFVYQKEKNILFKKSLGISLHGFLQRLPTLSLEESLALAEQAPLPSTDKKQIKQALAYITQLKQPDMSRFFKTGFAEWPFRLKKQNILLTGQIDLWAREGGKLHLFDYKSSLGQALKTKKQLIFYGFVLNEIHRPEKLYMYEMYPFQQTFKKSLFQASHKQEVSRWLNSLTQNPPP